MEREQFSSGWLDRWHRRYWTPGPERDRYNGLEPIVAITGGSQGIGCALAHEFVAAGHAVLLIARDPATLALAERDLTRSHADAVVFTHHVDLIDAEIRRGLEAHAAGLGYYIDVLVNAAAMGLAGPFISHTTRNVRDLVELNVAATTDLCRRLLPGMVARGRGGILNVSSLAGMVPGPHQAAYYASKAYMNSLGTALANETAGQGVRITTLVPGPVDTQFHERMGSERNFYLRAFGVMAPETVARAGFRGFTRRQRFVVPGLVHKFNAVALKLLPHRLTVPLMAFLLKRRDQEPIVEPESTQGHPDGDANGHT